MINIDFMMLKLKNNKSRGENGTTAEILSQLLYNRIYNKYGKKR